MSDIHAVVVDPGSKGRLKLARVSAPALSRSDALVQVRAISLNLGEIRRSLAADAGWRPGWDFAGTIETAAADGAGPKKGERVVGFLPAGAWAEQLAVPAANLAAIPDSVTFEQAATLPVAGMTALYALAKNGSILARKVLITGASGGVGHFAIQLAKLSGAHVVAAVRRREREKNAREAGADDVVTGEDLSAASRAGPYRLILESVGGNSLGAALSMLSPGGMCVLFGTSEAGETTFDARQFYSNGAVLYGFILFSEVKSQPPSQGLARLVSLLAEGRLKSPIEVKAPWSEIGVVAERLWNREIAGKAVLTL
ncbi:MAG: zinc-binding dehydrogenase [Candidatus Binataceae bacterium]